MKTALNNSRRSLLPTRPDWSLALPRPITIPDVMTLVTLADVRALIEKHLPEGHRQKAAWQHVAALLARGSDPADVSVALRLALSLDNVPYRIKWDD